MPCRVRGESEELIRVLFGLFFFHDYPAFIIHTLWRGPNINERRCSGGTVGVSSSNQFLAFDYKRIHLRCPVESEGLTH